MNSFITKLLMKLLIRRKTRMHQDFVANQFNLRRVQKLNFVYKEGLG